MIECLMVEFVLPHAVWYLSKDCLFPQHVATCVEKKHAKQIAWGGFTSLQVIILDDIYLK